MHLLRIYAALFSISLRRQLAFRTDLAFELVATLATLTSSLAAVLVLFTQTRTLAGFTPVEAVVLVGTFHIVTGLRRALVEPNLRFISGQVGDGSFDGLLLQPAPAVLLASLGGSAPLALAQAFLGGGVVAVAVQRMTPTPSAAGVVGWLIMISSAFVIMWATRCMVAAVVFWSLGLTLDVAYDAVWQTGAYPTAIFNAPVKIILTYLLPVAFLATVPTMVLTGRLAVGWCLAGVLAAAAAAVIAVLMWRAGLRRYSSATS